MPRKQAAVVVPLYGARDAGLTVVLIHRREGGLHGGELGFPGGRHIPADGPLLNTALRETHEEIGLPPDCVHIVEQLPAVETISSAYTITPFLARIDRPRNWVLSEQEVAEVLEVPVAELCRPEGRGTFLPGLQAGRALEPCPFIRVSRHRLWGVTYRILEPLLDKLSAGQW